MEQKKPAVTGLNSHDFPLTRIKGVGEQLQKKFESLGIYSVLDLMFFVPRKYDDFSVVTPIRQLSPGAVTVQGRVSIVRSRYGRRGMHITEGFVTDKTGRVPITWFNQPFRANSIVDKDYYVSGVFDLHAMKLSFVNPTIELCEESKDESRIRGVYRERKGLSSKQIRSVISKALGMLSIPERLPESIIKEYGLLPLETAIRELHFPSSREMLESATRRMSFEELFHLQLASEIERRKLQEEKAKPIVFQEEKIAPFVAKLPFALTDDQRRITWQIYKDMARHTPMNRLVEGDVGSGKTVIAALSALAVIEQGMQVLLMAPTELLARQHAETFYELFSGTPWQQMIGVLVGSMKAKEMTELHNRIASGDCRIVIGTHALIQDKLATKNVGLVIIDEQHRFGVEQRQKLRSKAGLFPHVLSMTATPIPRTLALTLYGELDISVLKTMPPGRKVTETQVVLFPARASVYERVREQLAAGRQAFVVAPLISDSEFMPAKAAETLASELRKGLLKDARVGLLHGSMKADEKEIIMRRFIEHDVDVLVATTVIEVGVNIPNASVMVIEGAERFGLAQLHQLRGRIGRSDHQGYCFVIPSQDIGMTKRMRAIESTTDGFRLAELDLELRGAGAIYGTRQSGALDLQYARLSDRVMVTEAKQAAISFLDSSDSLVHYPYIKERVSHFQSISQLN